MQVKQITFWSCHTSITRTSKDLLLVPEMAHQCHPVVAICHSSSSSSLLLSSFPHFYSIFHFSRMRVHTFTHTEGGCMQSPWLLLPPEDYTAHWWTRWWRLITGCIWPLKWGLDTPRVPYIGNTHLKKYVVALHYISISPTDGNDLNKSWCSAVSLFYRRCFWWAVMNYLYLSIANF